MPQILEYKCPCCSGIIEFDSATQMMKCPYCDTTFDVSALQEKDEALNNPKPDQMQWQKPDNAWTEEDHMNVYSCRSCGGEIITDTTTGATHCPFCGNPVVLTSVFAGDLKPDYVIPFKYDKEHAKSELRRYMSGKKLLPKLFSEENHLDEVKGVYVPFWLFDTEANAHINYQGTTARVWRSGDREFTETSHFRLERAGSIGFENIPVDGSSKMEDDMMESLEPFDFSEAKPFQTAYLSGYYADKYDVPEEESVERANNRVKRSTEAAFARTVNGFASVIPESTSIQLENGKAKYALYPVWILNTTYEGKQYRFAMNGQTGKFVGNMPVGKKEYWKWRLIYTGIIGGVIGAVITLFTLL